MAADPVISFGADGYIRVFNPAAERFFGYTAKEAEALCVTEILEFPDNDMSCATEAKAAKEGSEPVGDIFGRVEGIRRMWGVRKGGGRALIESNVSFATGEGGAVYTAILRDISAQLEIEDSLKKAKSAAENANRLKSEFLVITSYSIHYTKLYEDSSELYYVWAGTVDLVRENRVSEIGRGGMFGEFATLLGIGRTATAVAATDCVVLRIPSELFRETIEVDGKVSHRTLLAVSDYVRKNHLEVLLDETHS